MTEVKKGGLQSRRAAMLCQNARFCLYLDQRRRQKYGLALADLPDGTHTKQDAADFIRLCCNVESRAEIDHNESAKRMLDKVIVDYQEWERQQRVAG